MGSYDVIVIKLAEFSKREARKIERTIDEINRSSLERARDMNIPIKARSDYVHSVRLDMADDGEGRKVLLPVEIRMPKDEPNHPLVTRALNAIFLDHEVNEAEAMKRGNIRPIHTHVDPSIIMQEAKTISKFPDDIKDRVISMRMSEFARGEDISDTIRTGKKPTGHQDIPALERALLKHMNDGSETEASMYQHYDESNAELRSTQYLRYVRDMVSRAANRPWSKRESSSYTRYQDRLHPSLRYDIDEEKDTAKGIYSKAWKKVPGGASIGAFLGAGSGAILGGVLSEGKKIPSIASAALGAILGGTAGGATSYDKGVLEGVRKEYMGEDRRRPGSGQ